MWTLEDALLLIREIQPRIYKFAYHVCLGGGVLNRGESEKDLDLYFSPFSDTALAKPAELLVYLDSVLGTRYSLGGPSVNPEDTLAAYPAQTKTFPNGRYTYRQNDLTSYEKRIDVFIA